MAVLLGFSLALLLPQPEVSLPQLWHSAAASFSWGWVLWGPLPQHGHCLPSPSPLLALARDAIISSTPNSHPLPSSSFHKVFLKPPGPLSASNSSWVGKFPAQFLPLVSSVLFSKSFFHAVLSSWSSPDGTVIYIGIICAQAHSSSV